MATAATPPQAEAATHISPGRAMFMADEARLNAICRYFGHKIVCISLNFRDIKISIAPLDSPRKTSLEQIRKIEKN